MTMPEETISEARELASQLTTGDKARLTYLVEAKTWVASRHPVDAKLALCGLCLVMNLQGGDWTGKVTDLGRAVAQILGRE